MVVDDSAVVRQILSSVFTKHDDIELVVKAFNGKDALDKISESKPEVIILDVDMPFMNGLETIPELLKIDSKVKIIMFSAFTVNNAEVTLQSMQKGAVDYLLKPSSLDKESANFEHDLIQKVRTFGALYRGIKQETFDNDLKAVETKVNVKTKKPLPKVGIFMPKAIAIGSSTGGPDALVEVLRVAKDIHLPIFITQHMPKNFTKILAENIRRETGCHCVEASEGEIIRNKTVYVAPGGYHMTIKTEDDQKVIRLSDAEPVNYCKPAVDVMFESLIEEYGGQIFGVMLTGMGQDGLVGSASLVEAGGKLIAQDEETSVVWGMPGAVAKANLCEAILPVNEIGNYVKQSI